MTVTKEATVKVATTDFVHALKAVLPHHNKTKTGDAADQHAVRLIFAGKALYVAACNAQTTGISRVRIKEDTRGASGQLDGTPGPLDADDAPILFDLTPRRVRLLLQLFKPNAASSEVEQRVTFDLTLEDDGRVLDVTDVGGLYSDGESHRWPCDEPSKAFPDLLAVHGVAIANDRADTKARELLQDGAVMALFKAAGEAYKERLRLRTTGPEGSGWIVTCGPFVGTVASQPDGDGSQKDHEQQMIEWREELPMRQLRSA